ncbi:hypothetical protein CPB84DRAFT_1791584 [Gymnopilus junonius]|uniref:Uncharacterized protein n=1 Tax=Gymnopilus junonius TaxID=109634 RepID=A0A9P5NEA8_GYMJU|nr:hypothetical protein CPB84DRAFT_1791584 [Gymnopilus junonius]
MHHQWFHPATPATLPHEQLQYLSPSPDLTDLTDLSGDEATVEPQYPHPSDLDPSICPPEFDSPIQHQLLSVLQDNDVAIAHAEQCQSQPLPAEPAPSDNPAIKQNLQSDVEQHLDDGRFQARLNQVCSSGAVGEGNTVHLFPPSDESIAPRIVYQCQSTDPGPAISPSPPSAIATAAAQVDNQDPSWHNLESFGCNNREPKLPLKNRFDRSSNTGYRQSSSKSNVERDQSQTQGISRREPITIPSNCSQQNIPRTGTEVRSQERSNQNEQRPNHSEKRAFEMSTSSGKRKRAEEVEDSSSDPSSSLAPPTPKRQRQHENDATPSPSVSTTPDRPQMQGPSQGQANIIDLDNIVFEDPSIVKVKVKEAFRRSKYQDLVGPY